MKASLKSYFSAVSVGLLSLSLTLSSLTAVVTEPVGYVTRVINPGADLKIGIPLNQAKVYTGAVASVVSGTVNVTTTVPDVTSSAHYLQVSSGTLLGKWYQITGSATSSVTVADDLQAAGLAADDTFDIVPFWTLDALFPGGGDLPKSSNPFNPVALVALNDVTLQGTNLAAGPVYFYNDGTLGIEGWMQNGNLTAGLQGDTIISPESYITLRNLTESSVSVTMAGTVPTYTIANNIISSSTIAQDNQVSNPYPAAISLDSSDLVADGVITPSSDPFNPGDQLLVFTVIPTSQNPAADRVFFYHDGTLGAEGWYENGNLGAGLQGTFELPLGGALIIRKAQGTDSIVSWTPDTPYSL